MDILLFKRITTRCTELWGRYTLNAFFLAFSDIFGKGTLFAIFIFYARTFSIESFGHFSLAFNLCAIMVLIADPGINQFIIREVASQDHITIKNLTKLFFLKISLLIPFLAAAILYCVAFKVTGQPLIMIILMVSYYWTDSLHQFVRNIFRGREKMELDMFSRILERSTLLVSALFAIFILRSPVITIACFVVVSTISLCIDLFFLRPFSVNPGKQPHNGSELPNLVRKSLPFMLSHIIFLTYFRIDSIMLHTLVGFEEVGFYNAAYRILDSSQIIAGSFFGTLYPAFSRLNKISRREMLDLKKQATKILIPIGLLISVSFILFSKPLITKLFGDNYYPSANILSILSIGIVFNFYYVVFTSIFAVIDKQMLVTYFGLAILSVNVILNALLIPRYGGAGAALSTVLCEIIMALIVFMMLKRFVNEQEA